MRQRPPQSRAPLPLQGCPLLTHPQGQDIKNELEWTGSASEPAAGRGQETSLVVAAGNASKGGQSSLARDLGTWSLLSVHPPSYTPLPTCPHGLGTGRVPPSHSGPSTGSPPST